MLRASLIEPLARPVELISGLEGHRRLGRPVSLHDCQPCDDEDSCRCDHQRRAPTTPPSCVHHAACDLECHIGRLLANGANQARRLCLA